MQARWREQRALIEGRFVEDDDYYSSLKQIRANKSKIFVPLSGEKGELKAWKKQRCALTHP